MAQSDPTPLDSAPLTLSDSVRRGLEIIALRALDDPDDARDAVQETLSRALAALRNGRAPDRASLADFTFGIARHVITDVIRRRARERHVGTDPENLAATQPSPLEHLVKREEQERVTRAMARLPARDRELLRSCFVDGERVADIAERLGEPAARVRKRKSRALERLREMMSPSSGRHISSSDATSMA